MGQRLLSVEVRATGMSSEHTEIERLVDRIHRHLDDSPDGIRADQIDDLRAVLYGLDAVLTLHFAQEDEALFTMALNRVDISAMSSP
ncbi:hypothetical protein GCM10011610_12750 [Nocardia rhizosphaerihabitans]|uniref:Hemerythrin-like domain-containing protein n=2 Tax=Nocardia rhizosphaerihabitans TaxID=1691570 RepID=A0ABQ2K8T3_9NOCA|nr:hypothetical protein GCM10011610_12750 [Nocardia rhizosphaerihabitans]